MKQNDHLSHEISVVTPEQVRLTFQTAGLGSRAGAQAVDMLLLTLFFLLLFALTGEFDMRTRGTLWNGTSEYMAAVLIAIVVLGQFVYFVVCECTMGRTVGGRLIGLRVVQDNGRPVTVLSSLIRNFFRLIDMLPVLYVLGATVSFLHPRDKRIGDLVAGTVVIYDAPGRKRTGSKPGREAVQVRRMLPDILLEEYQKRAVTREDWLLLSAFAERQESLSWQKRDELAAGLAEHLAARMELPPERRRGVPDTDFVLAVYEGLREDWEI